MGLQVIFTFISFLSFLEGGEREGHPCVPMDVGMEPGSKTGAEEGTEFRSNFIHPFPTPTGLQCPSPTKFWGFVALKLTAVNVVTF